MSVRTAVVCEICDQPFFAGAGLANHQYAQHTPLWCVCAYPSVASAYGWTYCGRCLRGFQPAEAVSP